MMFKGSDVPSRKLLSLQASSLIYARGEAACCRAYKTLMPAFGSVLLLICNTASLS